MRGEGEHTLSDLLRALESERRVSKHVAGAVLSNTATALPTTPIEPSSHLERRRSGCRIATRACSTGYTLLGRRVDVVETSRGCTFDCSFCSIIEMRGRNFHPYPIERVIADIADARVRTARGRSSSSTTTSRSTSTRFEPLCEAIVDAGFNDIRLHGAGDDGAARRARRRRLAPLMRRAGFRYVFLGIENMLDDDLRFLRARAKNAHREHGRTVGNATHRGHRAICTTTACSWSAA